jgi:hypothetical protein
MQFAGMNYWAIVIAAIAGFVFGAAWYSVLGRPWLEAVGRTEQEIKASGPSPRLFAVAFVALLVMAWVLAGTIGHLGPGQVTLKNGVITGGFIWLGFVITTLVVNHGFQGARPMLTVIDGAHWLCVLLLQGAIIGAIGV